MQGARDIINQQISDSAEIKETVRKFFKKEGVLISAFKKLEEDKEKKGGKSSNP